MSTPDIKPRSRTVTDGLERAAAAGVRVKIVFERKSDARRYGLSAAELMEMRCNACHRAEDATRGMPLLNEAKALVKAKKCASCHAIEGKGGTAGPDLSTTGETPPERRHFPTGWTRPRTALGWHVGHMLEPTSTSPGSEMKVFGFSEREATALSVLVSSWRRVKLPAAWLPAKK